MNDDHAHRYSIIVDRSLARVYERWLEFENVPLLVPGHCTLRKLEEGRFLMTLLVDGQERRTVVRVLLRVPERRIAWQAESETREAGVVLFERVSDRSSEVSVRIHSDADPTTLRKVALECLERFKQFAESESP